MSFAGGWRGYPVAGRPADVGGPPGKREEVSPGRQSGVMCFEALLRDIAEAVRSAAGGRAPRPERRFHRHNEYISYELSTPVLRKVLKQFEPRVRGLTIAQCLEAARRLLSEQIGELGHAGIHILSLSSGELRPDHLPLLEPMIDDFRSWSQVDGFCAGVVQPLLDRYPRAMLAWLVRLSGSPNRFKRRAAVVPFTRKLAESGRFTSAALGLCEKLAFDDEDIVRKGVGWALKDCMRASPETVKRLVSDLRRRGASSTVTLYALRDLQGPEREAILAVSKAAPGKR